MMGEFRWDARWAASSEQSQTPPPAKQIDFPAQHLHMHPIEARASVKRVA